MPRFAQRTQFLGLAAWLGLGFLAAALGRLASARAGSFYIDLDRPAWAPPAEIFGPVWSVLYALMSIAAWLVWRRAGFQGAKLALVLFLVQLAFNALWSWLFFAWQLGLWSFADILLLWLLIVATVLAFWRVSRPAALLMLPYLAWVSYAGFLNYAVWELNPQVLG